MNKKRVQMLRDMLEGIPCDQIDLDIVRISTKPCNSIACIGGWAELYPPFIKMGVRRQFWSDFFGIKATTFSPRAHNERGTDKQIALARLDALLGH